MSATKREKQKQQTDVQEEDFETPRSTTKETILFILFCSTRISITNQNKMLGFGLPFFCWLK